jgi:hypothetical protein
VSGPDAQGGFVLASLDTVDEFVADHAAGNLPEDDRRISGSHPLVVLVESALESISTPVLKTAIVGLSRESEARLVEQRRRLEERDVQPALQAFLFAFESTCAVVRESGYGSHDPDASRHFFAELFPDWLEGLTNWATEAGYAELHGRASHAVQIYSPVADEIAE